jgi:hypothetical protein
VHCEAYIGYPFDENLHYISLMDHTFQPLVIGLSIEMPLTRMTPVTPNVRRHREVWRTTLD